MPLSDREFNYKFYQQNNKKHEENSSNKRSRGGFIDGRTMERIRFFLYVIEKRKKNFKICMQYKRKVGSDFKKNHFPTFLFYAMIVFLSVSSIFSIFYFK